MTSKSTEKNVLNIEKYDFDEYEKEQKPYALILTHVIQNIKRDLNGLSCTDNLITVESCIGYCMSKSFMYAGLEK